MTRETAFHAPCRAWVRGDVEVIAPLGRGFRWCPGARIFETGEDGSAEVGYDEAGPVQLTRGFLTNPQRYLHHLLRQL